MFERHQELSWPGGVKTRLCSRKSANRKPQSCYVTIPGFPLTVTHLLRGTFILLCHAVPAVCSQAEKTLPSYSGRKSCRHQLVEETTSIKYLSCGDWGDLERPSF